jgi:hypothetical protein
MLTQDALASPLVYLYKHFKTTRYFEKSKCRMGRIKGVSRENSQRSQMTSADRPSFQDLSTVLLRHNLVILQLISNVLYKKWAFFV